MFAGGLRLVQELKHHRADVVYASARKRPHFLDVLGFEIFLGGNLGLFSVLFSPFCNIYIFQRTWLRNCVYPALDLPPQKSRRYTIEVLPP